MCTINLISSQLLFLKDITSCFQVESSDFISYGLIPEFIGRFPILVSLSALTEDQLVQVLFIFCFAFSFYFATVITACIAYGKQVATHSEWEDVSHADGLRQLVYLQKLSVPTGAIVFLL